MSNEAILPPAELSPLEARVLGVLMEKEATTPDVYPLTLNSLVNACNQKNNRAPVMAVGETEVKAALELLRQKQLVTYFAGADARVPKFRHKFELVYPMEPVARALLCEFLLRGPQTTAGVRGNAERLHAMPDLAEVEAVLQDLAVRPAGALVRKLARQAGQKEARWATLLTGEPAEGEVPAASSAEVGFRGEPVKVALTLPPEVEARLATLEAEVATLRQELVQLRAALGE